MEVNDYKDLMDTIQNLRYEVVGLKRKCIRALTICLLVYIAGTLGCFGIVVYDYIK